ncbi:Glutamate carboxypeptidase II [Candidatus Sulfotelmatomonas gaucii]|uniref:Glutamate carboxypeptidase II n=1 Tax=Candidatus Sulfuritelmatomonas gaucii TaxID=2043161 RepID=A0A2N9LGV3_9BACT|nr:Glutamate carboxypeptidase II [Candidatus Sulfotelmatomonas gaucii]
MNVRVAAAFFLSPALFLVGPSSNRLAAQAPTQKTAFGYSDFGAEAKLEEKFLAVPDAKLAGEELKTLTAEPHLAATPEDHATAEYVAGKFRAAGLETTIVPYRVLLNWPKDVRVEAFDAEGHLLMSGPTREHVTSDAQQDNPRVVMPFNGSSGSGDVTGEVVYANYGRLEDFNELATQHVDVRGKIVICRYGSNFRGVKVYLAEQRGAIGVLLYSDPQDDGYYKGDPYPNGPWRPATGVQRGSVQYLFKYPGDPETPGVASTPELPDSARVKNFTGPDGDQPHIISIPISYHDAAPILQALKGPGVPEGWQGALPFRYHLGPGGAKVHLVSQQDYERRIIWDVIGRIKGAQEPDEAVIVGNHRDAWVYGAVDPNSGTAAMLEAVHGLGDLAQQGWRPKRTIIFCSWDAEEEGLIGSTEWVEQQAQALDQAVAYFNVDVGVSGPNFSAAAVPSLKEFVRNITREVPSPMAGTVFDQWRTNRSAGNEHRASNAPPEKSDEVHVGDLGSGSDFTPFLQHAGVPSTDVTSGGPYGVYHSTFDDFAWFTQNADPHFLNLQEMARVLGLETMRMADADVLPYDYVAYAHAISAYIGAAKQKAADAGISSLDFAPAEAAVARFAAAAQQVHAVESAPSGDLAKLNLALRQTETALLSPDGLPNRPWFRHTIYAPGEYTGYAAVVIPGVNEAIDVKNASLAAQQLQVLADALDRAAGVLEKAQ